VFIDHARDGLSGLYTIVGGKWTTGRATGEQMLDLLLRKHPGLAAKAASRLSTRRLPVPGSFGWAVDPEPFISEAVSRWAANGVSEAVARHVLRLYGTQAEAILELVRADSRLGQRVSGRPGVLDIGAQAIYAVHAEGARTLADVMDRRLAIGTLGSVEASEVLTIAETIAPLTGIDAPTAAQAELLRRRAGLAFSRYRGR
jgi:glycerol-3-phosphate dehydrogenase